MGDSVDNIKGVPGVGAKTAAALMKEFVSLEELYDNLDGWPTSRCAARASSRRNSSEHREAAFLARRLTEIACDMPLEIGATELARRAPDVAALTEFFDRHNFGPMLRRQAERLALLPLPLPDLIRLVGLLLRHRDACRRSTRASMRARAVLAHREIAARPARHRYRRSCRSPRRRCPSRLRRECCPSCPARP